MPTRSPSPHRTLWIALLASLLTAPAAPAGANDLPSPAVSPAPSGGGVCIVSPPADDPAASPGGGASVASPDPDTGASLPASETEDCPSPPPQVSPAPSESSVPGGSPVPSASLATQVVAVRSGEFWFEPGELVIPAAGATTLILANSGISVHNFTVDELGVEIVASRGRSGQTTVVDPPPGAYLFYCSVSGHKEAGMVGRLIVE